MNESAVLAFFLLVYWLFSMFFYMTYREESIENRSSFLSLIGVTILGLIISPIATPIILGIAIGQAIKED